MTATDDFISAVFDLTESVRTVIIDPAAQINAMAALCSYPAPEAPVGTSPINTAVAAVTLASAALCRRAALTSLGYACALYAPTSSTDCQTVIDLIAPLFDAEILFSADTGDNDTYSALRVLRTSVISDLQVRGSQLPQLITYQFQSTLPSLVIAYNLYHDALRSDDIIQRADPPNPLFCPLNFVALSV